MSLGTATARMFCSVVETLTTGVATVSSPTITHNVLGATKTLSPATKIVSFTKAMSGGAGTIDLTSLTGANGSVDGTGLKVQWIWFKATTGNANDITIKEGASNGYALAGASWQVILSADQEFGFIGNDNTPDIGATDKTIDLSGTLAQSVEVVIIMG